MYKRPTIRRVVPKTQFVTEIRADGTRASYWAPVTRPSRVPSGAPGLAGAIVDKMRLGDDHVKRPVRKEWTPPLDWELVVRHMAEGERQAYTARCLAWFEAHPPPVRAPPQIKSEIDHQLIAAMYAKWNTRPPLEERLKVFRAAGHTEAYIEKVRARDAHWHATKAERDAAFELIFAKWPSASKPVPKSKKVIKAVKKRVNP